ncbi:MAG: hypothetical protein MR033_01080 [Clostridiales bacterium]|nr:hypothetical protein [Clostridiales bacterium]
MIRVRYALFCLRICLRKWLLGLNRKTAGWLQWEQMDELEGGEMIKGVSRRVVVVKSPDPRIFEQAIFIVREDFLERSGVSSEDVLRQASAAADDYIRGTLGRKRRRLRLPAPLIAAAGAVATAAAWLTMHFVGV